MIFAQVYSRWTRFECRVFLTEALAYFGGAAAGACSTTAPSSSLAARARDMAPAPEMAAFAERFGFAFVAHELGDANRSARVERRFHFIENNFYPGRDLRRPRRPQPPAARVVRPRQSPARRSATAERVPDRALPGRAAPASAAAAARAGCLRLARRRVDVEGYVNLHTNRYSVAGRAHRPARRGPRDA